jgi:hypothetical protein
MRSLKIINIVCLILVMGSSLALSQGATYTISWNPVSDPNVVEVLVYRSLTETIADFSLIGSVSPAQTSYDDNGLDSGVQYYYRLRCRGAAGDTSAYSEQVSGLTLSGECSEALKDRCRIASIDVIDQSSCSIGWSTAAPTTGRLRYWLMGQPRQLSGETVSPTTDHLTVLGGLEQDQIYFVHAVAHDQSGNMTISCDSTFSTSSQPGELNFVVENDRITVPEGGTEDVRIMLSGEPSEAVSVTVSRAIGDTDITVQSGGSLSFDSSNWNQYQSVTIAGAEDVDVAAGEATLFVHATAGPAIADKVVFVTEEDNDVLAFEADSSSITVSEGGTGVFGVRISAQPSETVEVSVSCTSGDTDISIESGAALSFTSLNWNEFQTVTVAAAEDDDSSDGEAVICIHATAGPAIGDLEITAFEYDNEPGGGDPPNVVASGLISVYPIPFQPDLGVLNINNLPESGDLEVYDLLGRRVWDASWSGRTEVTWDGSNNNSTDVSSGRYFLVVKAGGGDVIDKRVILVIR